MLGRSVGSFALQCNGETLCAVESFEVREGLGRTLRPSITKSSPDNDDQHGLWELFDFTGYHGVRNVATKEWLSCGPVNPSMV